MLPLDERNGVKNVKGRRSFACWPPQGQLCERSGRAWSAVEFWPAKGLLEESGGWHVESLRRQLR